MLTGLWFPWLNWSTLPVDDMGPVRRSIQYMLDYFMDKPFENQSVGAISEDLYAYNQLFRFSLHVCDAGVLYSGG